MSSVELRHIQKLNQILADKNWKRIEKPRMDRIKNNMLELLEQLQNVEQIDLVLSLTDNFSLYILHDYVDLTKKVIDKFVSSEINFVDYDAYIIAGIREVNSPKLRSGSGEFISVHVDSILNGDVNIDNKLIHRISDITKIERLINNGRLEKILLVLTDDFIGTADTVFGMLKYLSNNNYFRISIEIVVLSLVALEYGYKRLLDKGISTFAVILHNRGISDSDYIEDKPRAIKNMNAMEGLLRLKLKYRFGYGRSEALVSMANNTPNNTFPIFWCEYASNRGIWPAPFPRRST